MNMFRPLLLASGLLVLTACAHQATVIPDHLKVCQVPERPAAEGLTIGELAVFSQEQEAALQLCQKQLTEASELIDPKWH